ncbi:hypothetical protein HID58_067476, partial [Brassica napus]
ARSLGNLEKHVALASFRREQPKIRNLEAGIWNLEPGTHNLEAGTRNPEPGSWDLEPRGLAFFFGMNNSGNKPASLHVEFSIFSGSFAGGGAVVLPALGQGSFCGTTPTEFDEEKWLSSYLLVVVWCAYGVPRNSSFDSPTYVTYQSCEPGRKLLCAASEPFIFLLWGGVMRLDALVASGLARLMLVDYPLILMFVMTAPVKTRDQLDPRNVEAGLEPVGNQMLLKSDSRLGPGVGSDQRL